MPKKLPAFVRLKSNASGEPYAQFNFKYLISYKIFTSSL